MTKVVKQWDADGGRWRVCARYWAQTDSVVLALSFQSNAAPDWVCIGGEDVPVRHWWPWAKPFSARLEDAIERLTSGRNEPPTIPAFFSALPEVAG